MDSSTTAFPVDPSGLPEARRPEVLTMGRGARFDLRIGPVAKRLGDATVRMLAYNNSIPGPTIRVRQGSEVLINVINDGDLETRVHWHGLRLENRNDGTAQTQQPIPVGGRFTYQLTFPDPGIYCAPWCVSASATRRAGTSHPGVDAGEHEHHVRAEHRQYPAGIEWEDDMVDVNRLTTPANMRWKLIDRATGAEGSAINWRFRIGERVKIRVMNEMDSDHPMHHPFHIHGAGRFLILARDGAVEPNLVWKDTVLVPTGQIVDLLLDVTNPGVWMAHCHIAEHHESGMMFSFRVDP